MALLSVLLLLEVGLGALQPWPLKIVIDHILSSERQPIPEPFRSWLTAVDGGNLIALLVLVVVGGVLLQAINQLVTAYATQLQVDTGQRMVYELGAGSSSRFKPSACTITSPRTRATRCTASTSTRTRSRTS